MLIPMLSVRSWWTAPAVPGADLVTDLLGENGFDIAAIRELTATRIDWDDAAARNGLVSALVQNARRILDAVAVEPDTGVFTAVQLAKQPGTTATRPSSACTYSPANRPEPRCSATAPTAVAISAPR